MHSSADFLSENCQFPWGGSLVSRPPAPRCRVRPRWARPGLASRPGGVNALFDDELRSETARYVWESTFFHLAKKKNKWTLRSNASSLSRALSAARSAAAVFFCRRFARSCGFRKTAEVGVIFVIVFGHGQYFKSCWPCVYVIRAKTYIVFMEREFRVRCD